MLLWKCANLSTFHCRLCMVVLYIYLCSSSAFWLWIQAPWSTALLVCPFFFFFFFNQWRAVKDWQVMHCHRTDYKSTERLLWVFFFFFFSHSIPISMTYVVFARSPGVSLIYDCGQNSNRAKHLFHKWTEWYTLTAKREFSGCDLQ